MKHTYDFSKYIAVTNRQLAGSDDSYFSQIEKIAALEPHAVILREKELNREEYAVFAARVKKICDKYGVTLFIHSHIDTARALCCKHLHLSFADFCCNTEKHENVYAAISMIIRYFDNSTIILTKTPPTSFFFT